MPSVVPFKREILLIAWLYVGRSGRNPNVNLTQKSNSSPRSDFFFR